MTNFTYKLFIDLIMRRILNSFDFCIGTHQTGFMPERSIFDNIKKAQMLINRANQLSFSLYLALLDQEKVYDQIDHDFLWKCLTQFEFNSDLILVIQNCYVHACSTVPVNRHISEFFAIERELRQNDSLSCVLYNVAIESLTK